MNFYELSDYWLYDFAEYFLGYSLRGSGRFVTLQKLDTEKILKVKRFFVNRCENNEFIFSENKCILSRNYWNSQDITQEFISFYNMQQSDEFSK